MEAEYNFKQCHVHMGLDSEKFKSGMISSVWCVCVVSGQLGRHIALLFAFICG